MDSFKDFINQWPTRSDLAADLGISAWTVQKWTERNSMPASAWVAALAAAKAKKRKGSLELFARWAAK